LEKIHILGQDKLEQHTIDYLIAWSIGPNLANLQAIDPLGAIRLEATANKQIKEVWKIHKKDKQTFVTVAATALAQMYGAFMIHRTQRLIKDGIPGLQK
jgi:hypothetical protein